MEKVDIVDENLKVLYSVSKKVAHEKGLLHATIVAEVKNDEGKFLLVKQAGHKQDAGQFVSPVGGHVKSGESEIEALKREVEEEIGIRNFSQKRIGQAIYNRTVRGEKENHYFIIYEIKSNDSIILNDESVEFRWFTAKEIRDQVVTNPKFFGDAFYQILNKFSFLFI